MLRSANIGQVAAALATAQGSFPPIPKDRTVKVKTRTGGEYTFSYAPLDTILAKVRPCLAANGLAIAQAVVTDDKGVESLRTELLHASGEWLANDVPVLVASGDNGAQAYGSAMTYARRYGITALLCVAADDDDDGNMAEGNNAQPVQRQAKAPPKAAPIGKGQLSALREMLGASNTAEGDFCAFLGVQSLDALDSSRFGAAKAALEKKLAKLAREEAAAMAPSALDEAEAQV